MIRRRPAVRAARLSLLGVALVLGLAACSNSKFLLGAFYDRAGDRAVDTADDWVALSAAQRSEFEIYVDTFHLWHRREQLPAYATLIRDMTAGLATHDVATPDDFTGWLQRLAGHVAAVRECHPLRFAGPLLPTLTDEQVDRLEAEWREERAEDIERASKRTRVDRVERRVDRIATWSGRLGLDLDDDQLELIRTNMLEQHSLQQPYRELSDRWHEELFAILGDRDASDQDARFEVHMDGWFGMVEKAYPREFQENRDRWRDAAVAFEKSLSGAQRRDMLRWLDGLADTLDSIGRDRVAALAIEDPAYGCQVESAGGPAGTADD